MQAIKDKILSFLESKYFVPVVIILVAIIGFCLGRVSGLEEKREPVRVLDNSGEVKGVNTEGTEKVQPSQDATADKVVASKNGTKYHYPWCAGAKQISAQNLISFDSIEAARASGYTPASNCKGLK